jgi:hypothetical protein
VRIIIRSVNFHWHVRRLARFSLGVALITTAIGSALSAPPSAAPGATKLSENAIFLAPLPPLPPGSALPSRDPRDLTGIYYSAAGTSAVPDGPGAASAGTHGPSYTAEAKRYLQYANDMEAKGTPLGGLKATCRPYVGIRGSYIPGMIVQSPDEIVIVGEQGRNVWQIHMSRNHPKQVHPSYLGDSVGHWVGNTLVVDIIGFNGEEALISKQQHVVVHIQKLDNGNKLEMQFTITDPVNYTEPYEMTGELAWRPDYDVYEDQCEEDPESARQGLYVP